MNKSSYLQEIKGKNKRITAKFMTLVENNDTDAINELKTFFLEKSSVHTIGVTGLPGAGKSSLINNLIKYYRSKNLIIGVLAIDPTSSLTGGAILGDRIRMNDYILDENVFIRSMATRGKLGGLAPTTTALIKILDVYGCDIIIIETVGTGQSEIDIAGLVDTVIVVSIPGTGDIVQALKAGVLEIADIFVINKSDQEGAAKHRLFLQQLIELDTDNNNNNKWNRSIVETIAIKKDLKESGTMDLVEKIENHFKNLKDTEKIISRRKSKILSEILSIIQHKIKNEFLEDYNKEKIDSLIEKIINNELDPYTVAEEFLSSKRT